MFYFRQQSVVALVDSFEKLFHQRDCLNGFVKLHPMTGVLNRDYIFTIDIVREDFLVNFEVIYARSATHYVQCGACISQRLVEVGDFLELFSKRVYVYSKFNWVVLCSRCIFTKASLDECNELRFAIEIILCLLHGLLV